jgi:hypothetical protein
MKTYLLRAPKTVEPQSARPLPKRRAAEPGTRHKQNELSALYAVIWVRRHHRELLTNSTRSVSIQTT